MSQPIPVRHVIVQAGGKGTRLEHYCWNKPKCLVPINGATLLYSLFSRFSTDTEFIVIGNHHFDVLERVLQTFKPTHAVKLVRGNSTGTIDGLGAAIRQLPDDRTPFLLVWSDIYFEECPTSFLTAPENTITVGVTHSFPCRWRMGASGGLEERATPNEGVFGLFSIPDRTWLADLPAAGGEFVRWLAQRKLPVKREYFDRVSEYGTLEALHSCWAGGSFCRFFNEVTIAGDTVVKRAKLASHAHLIADEINWYQFVHARGYTQTPRLLATQPMTIERVMGQHPFDLPTNYKHRRVVLERIFAALDTLHRLTPDQPVVPSDVEEIYRTKTIQRLENFRSLRPDLAARESITVNGYTCRNPLHPAHRAWFDALINEVQPTRFAVIHGDPTFSNTLVTDEAAIRFIDPRGRFGHSAVYGDPMYDWAKLYYSVVGGYDQFNRRQFLLSLEPDNVELSIRNSGWAHLSGLFEARFSPEDMRRIHLLHALIWLSLSGYVQDDYDSILGAFFKGILELHHATAHDANTQHVAQDLDLRPGRAACAA